MRGTTADDRLIRGITDYIFISDAPCQSDIIFVPGSMSPWHALRAAELYHSKMAPFILPSGRYSVTLGHPREPDEYIRGLYPGTFETEYAFLEKVLLEAGVPKAALLREDQATYTWENALFSRQVTDQAGLKIKKAILCVKPYHARRALTYYRAAFPECSFCVCPATTARVTRENWYLSASGRRKVFNELAKAGTQVREQFDLLFPLE